MNRAAGAKQSYNYSRGSKSFQQQLHELSKHGHLVDHVELFKEAHAQASQNVFLAVVGAHVSLCDSCLILYVHFNLHVLLN